MKKIFGSVGGYAAFLEETYAADDDFEREVSFDRLVNFPTSLPESLADEFDEELAELLKDAVEAAEGANGLDNLYRWIVTSGDEGPASLLPDGCIDTCCEWRFEIRREVAEINGVVADLEADLADQDTEVNRAAFTETSPEDSFTLFPAPAQPEGGCAHDESFYTDLWDEAVYANEFIAAFQSWCADDGANCPIDES